MKTKILQTALLTSIISIGLGAYTANAQNSYELMLVDHYDNGNIKNSNYATNGSRAYGYLYQTPDAERKYRNPYLYTNTESYKIPEWFCMTAEGLPTLLPQSNLKYQPDLVDDGILRIYYNPITIDNLIDITKEKDHFDLNKVTKVEVDEFGRNVFTFEDGQVLTNYINPSDSHIFYYSTNGTDWIGYNNRDEVNLPENTCITDFKLSNNNVPEGVILAYNMKVVDIDNLPSPQEGTPDMIEQYYDDEWNLVEELIQGSPSIPAMFHKLPDIQETCQEINITANVEKTPDPVKPADPLPDPVKPADPVTVTPPAPTTSGSSGPGGYYPVDPIEVIPLNSAPLSLQCQNIVKNLDDARLLEYYKKLQVETGLNVHGDISRLDLVRLMVNAGYLNVDASEDVSVLNDFADVAKNSWYAPYVAKLIKKDIISLGELSNDEKNNSLKLFDIYGNIAREDAVKILSSIIAEKNLRLPTLDEILTFSDVKNTDKNADYIQYAYNACLVHGRKTLDGNPINKNPRVFEGKSNITLAEVSKILFNGQDLRK